MPRESLRQRRTAGRVLHEFKHGELKCGRGGKVKSRKQAIAIALNEAGASKYDSKRQNERNREKYRSREKEGRTGQQEKEGKSHVGAKGKRESTPAQGGKNARQPSLRGEKAARARVRNGATRAELYEKARRRHIPNRSKMTKQQLENALA
jgi:hypothetical protein